MNASIRKNHSGGNVCVWKRQSSALKISHRLDVRMSHTVKEHVIYLPISRMHTIFVAFHAFNSTNPTNYG